MSPAGEDSEGAFFRLPKSYAFQLRILWQSLRLHLCLIGRQVDGCVYDMETQAKNKSQTYLL